MSSVSRGCPDLAPVVCRVREGTTTPLIGPRRPPVRREANRSSGGIIRGPKRRKKRVRLPHATTARTGRTAATSATLARAEPPGWIRLPEALAHPDEPRATFLLAAREAVVPHRRPHPARPLAVERVDAPQPQSARVGLEQAAQERVEPAGVGRTEREEPHEPAEPQVVGRELPRDAARVARLAAELVGAPLGRRVGELGIGAL